MTAPGAVVGGAVDRAPGRPACLAGEPILRVEGVTKRYRSRRFEAVAVDSVDLELRRGEFVAILGPSGCGKSTLLALVAGLERPSSGVITIAGQAVTRPGPDRVVMFQDHALFPWMTVRQNVEYGLRMQGMERRERKVRVDWLLRTVGLERFSAALVHELSGGMKQRVQLARSLAVEPAVLLMDEPFAALDAQTREVLHAELQAIWAATGASVLFVTHSVEEAVVLADRVAVMTRSPGRIGREFEVRIPRPRRPDSPEVTDLAHTIREALRCAGDLGEPVRGG